jgi:hypothetical protein
MTRTKAEEKVEEEKLPEASLRRLDSIAWLVQGNDPCGAACFDGKCLLLSVNDDATTAAKVQKFLQDVAQLAAKFNGVNDKNKIIKAIKNQIKELKSYFEKYVRLYNAPDDEYRRAVKDSIEKIAYSITNAAIEKAGGKGLLKGSQGQQAVSISQPMFEAILNKQVLIIKPEKGSNKRFIHAEMNILYDLMKHNLLNGDKDTPPHYIGISKRCCEKCEVMIKVINEVMGTKIKEIEAEVVQVRDEGHGICFACGIPKFIDVEDKTLKDCIRHRLRSKFFEKLSSAVGLKLSGNSTRGDLEHAFNYSNAKNKHNATYKEIQEQSKGQLHKRSVSPKIEVWDSVDRFYELFAAKAQKGVSGSLSSSTSTTVKEGPIASSSSTSSSSSRPDEKAIVRLSGMQAAHTPKELLELLSSITKPKSSTLQSNTWATGEGIYQALIKHLGSSAHIIHPDTSSIESLADPAKAVQGAIAYAQMISGYYVNDELHNKGAILNSKDALDKPIVMIWNTMSVKAASSKSATTTGGSHWQTCVIIPKNYKTLTGTQLNNKEPKVFFIDSLNENVKLPEPFKYLLTKGYTHTFSSDDKIARVHKIPAVFQQAEFIERTPKQQLEGYDCGWWTVYNAMMVVLTGGVEFLDKFTQRSREPAYALRTIFQGMDQDVGRVAQISKKQQPLEDITQSENIALQAAILASIQSSKVNIAAKEDAASSLSSQSKVGQKRKGDPVVGDGSITAGAPKQARIEQTAHSTSSSSSSVAPSASTLANRATAEAMPQRVSGQGLTHSAAHGSAGSNDAVGAPTSQRRTIRDLISTLSRDSRAALRNNMSANVTSSPSVPKNKPKDNTSIKR